MNFGLRFFLKKKHNLTLVIVLSIITFFLNLGKAPIYILDEAKNAQCAREMLQADNWVIPTFNQILRSDKPPLHYFFMAAAYKLFGINEFSARFFSALCGVLLIIITYLFVSKYENQRTGFITSIILLSSLHFGLEMRLAVPDPYLIFFTTAGLFSFYNFYQSAYSKQFYLFIFYVCTGLGVLTKGPVALILPGISIITFLLFEKQLSLKTFNKFKPVSGLLIVLAISLPWYIMVDVATHGKYTREFFIQHNYHRFADIKEGHGGFFLLTLVYAFLGMMPVTIFLWPAAVYNWKIYKGNTLLLYTRIITIVFLVFYTLSETKLPNYAMPCYPFIAYLFAKYFISITKSNAKITGLLVACLVIAISVPIAVYFIISHESTISHMHNLWLCFLILPAGMIGAIVFQYKKIRSTLLSVQIMTLTFMATGWVFNAYAFPKVYSQNIVTTSINRLDNSRPVVAFQIYNPAYNFYLKYPVKRIDNADSLKAYINKHSNIQIITRKESLKGVQGLNYKINFCKKDIFESHNSCIITPVKH